MYEMLSQRWVIYATSTAETVTVKYLQHMLL